MHRIAVGASCALHNAAKQFLNLQAPATSIGLCNYHQKPEGETDEQTDQRYVKSFSDPNIDGWWIRKHMNDITGYDMVPDPEIIKAAMHACRRNNDLALAIRFLEMCQYKTTISKKNDWWAYIVQEVNPTCKDLGIPLPAELGYDKPELALKEVEDLKYKIYGADLK